MKRAAMVLVLALFGSGLLAGCAANSAMTVGTASGASSESGNASGAATPDSQTVTYDGVSLDVPASWPVIDGAHAAWCANPFLHKPTVFVGQLLGAPSCPFFGPDSQAPKADGVWLTENPVGPTGSSHLTTVSGATLLIEPSGPAATSDYFWIHGVSIQLGHGPDPNVARAIERSVRRTPEKPNSPVQGYCPRGDAVAMPTPQRLTETMVLSSGDVTLGPPRADDVAQVSAAQVWRDDGQHASGTTYRLLLARYTSRFPAYLNKNGSTTPIDSDKLAWVIYSQPVNTSVGACGLSGINAYDASTGRSLASIGYVPGP